MAEANKKSNEIALNPEAMMVASLWTGGYFFYNPDLERLVVVDECCLIEIGRKNPVDTRDPSPFNFVSTHQAAKLLLPAKVCEAWVCWGAPVDNPESKRKLLLALGVDDQSGELLSFPPDVAELILQAINNMTEILAKAADESKPMREEISSILFKDELVE